jgi:hypothetical protein
MGSICCKTGDPPSYGDATESLAAMKKRNKREQVSTAFVCVHDCISNLKCVLLLLLFSQKVLVEQLRASGVFVSTFSRYDSDGVAKKAIKRDAADELFRRSHHQPKTDVDTTLGAFLNAITVVRVTPCVRTLAPVCDGKGTVVIKKRRIGIEFQITITPEEYESAGLTGGYVYDNPVNGLMYFNVHAVEETLYLEMY